MRVLLVPDSKQWAFGHCAAGIAKFAPSGYPVTVLDQCEFSDISRNATRLASQFDVVCQFAAAESTVPLAVRNVGVVAHPGWMHDKTSGFLEERLATRIRNAKVAGKLFPQFDSLLCFNRRLANFTRRYTRARWCPPGFDPDVFYPVPRKPGSVIRIGWCGQKPTEGRLNQKGYDVLESVMEHVLGAEWVVNDRTSHDALSQAEMADWYRSLDLFLVTALDEGGPMPPLEAMACGVPVVSTDVGVLKDLKRRGAPIATVPTYRCEADQEACAEELAGEIVRVIPVCAEVGRQSAAFMRACSWERLAGHWLRRIAGA